MSAPLTGNTIAQTQAADSQQAAKAAAQAAEKALDESNAAIASQRARGQSDDAGINTTLGPLTLFETEPNQTPATANSIAAALNATRYVVMTGAINPAEDDDFYTFTAAANSRIWLSVDTGGPAGPGSTNRDSLLHLFAADGTTEIEADDNDGTGNGGDATVESGLASVIAGRTLTAGGTYYIRVRAFSGGAVINPYRLFVVVTTATATIEVEGNNSAFTANTAVPMGGSLGLRSAAINVVGDVDYYSVAATAGSIIYFAVDADPERDGPGTDVAVELRSPADELLFTVDSGLTIGSLTDPTAEGANFAVLTDGVYFIKVKHFSNTATGTYHLMAAVSVPAEDEPNNTAATAEALDFTSSARRAAIITGSISPSDVDFYSFQAAAGSRVWIVTDTGGTQNSGATSRDTVIDLLAADSVTVIENDDDDGTGNGGDGTIETGLASIIGGRVLTAGGTYYIKVSAFSATAIIDPYKLFVVVSNSTPLPEAEGNDTFGTANVLSSPIALRAGAIGSPGDADYYSFFADPGSMLYVNVDGDPERDGTGTDLVVEVHNAADAVLLSIDSSITGSLANPAAEGATFALAQGSQYFVKVRHFSASGTGTYHLMIIAASGNGSPAFTNSPLFAGITPVFEIHFAELRSRVHFLRSRFGLGSFSYTHPSLSGARIDAVDLAELRTALAQAYTAAGRTAPAFTDPVIFPGATVIKAVHIEQLRAAVLELEGS